MTTPRPQAEPQSTELESQNHHHIHQWKADQYCIISVQQNMTEPSNNDTSSPLKSAAPRSTASGQHHRKLVRTTAKRHLPRVSVSSSIHVNVVVLANNNKKKKTKHSNDTAAATSSACTTDSTCSPHGTTTPPPQHDLMKKTRESSKTIPADVHQKPVLTTRTTDVVASLNSAVSATTKSAPATFSESDNKKKSATAGTNPTKTVPLTKVQHTGAGLIVPGRNDVIFGRGTGLAQHPGNVQFRQFCSSVRKTYMQTVRRERRDVAEIVCTMVRNLDPPGRFLLQNVNDGTQQEMFSPAPQSRIAQKICQALREKKWSLPGLRLHQTDIIQSAPMSYEEVMAILIKNDVLKAQEMKSWLKKQQQRQKLEQRRQKQKLQKQQLQLPPLQCVQGMKA